MPVRWHGSATASDFHATLSSSSPTSSLSVRVTPRRIYSKLPEVRKKKEAEKKRAVSQTNRLRVEVFKKVDLESVSALYPA